MLVVNSTQKFESVDKLVEFYYTHSFYKGLKLKHPINEELIKFSQTVEVHICNFIILRELCKSLIAGERISVGP